MASSTWVLKTVETLDEFAAVDGVSSGGPAYAGNQVVLAESMSEPHFEVEAAHGSAMLAGVLKINGSPDSSEGKTGIVVESLASGTSIAVPVGPGNAFSVPNLPAGEYRVYGWRDLSRVPYKSQAFLSDYANDSVSVTLEDNSATGGLEVEAYSSDL